MVSLEGKALLGLPSVVILEAGANSGTSYVCGDGFLGLCLVMAPASMTQTQAHLCRLHAALSLPCGRRQSPRPIPPGGGVPHGTGASFSGLDCEGSILPNSGPVL